MSAECQEKSVRRLIEKIRGNADEITRFVELETEGADVVVVSGERTGAPADPASSASRARDGAPPSPGRARFRSMASRPTW